MLAEVVASLRCPHCAGDLSRDGQSLRCAGGHTFDIARQGYVNLLPGDAHTGSADTADMVRAREEFLAAGHYDAITHQLASCTAAAVGARAAGCIADVGGGTGHHLAAVLARLPRATGVCLDLSKYALRRAARADARIGAVAADVWRHLPLHDGAALAALSVFAPRNADELWRVLRHDGVLVVVTPTPRHLTELTEQLELLRVDQDKPRRLDEQLDPYFELGERQEVEAAMQLGAPDVEALVLMGPNARHRDPAALRRRIAGLAAPMDVTASVVVALYRRRVRPR